MKCRDFGGANFQLPVVCDFGVFLLLLQQKRTNKANLPKENLSRGSVGFSSRRSTMPMEDEAQIMLISPADPKGSPVKDQQAAGVGILLQIMMLVLSFVLGHVLRRHRLYFLPEASASLLIGILSSFPFSSTSLLPLHFSPFPIITCMSGLIVGGLANISNTETNIRFNIFLLSICQCRRLLWPE